jgi:multiple sugar transport system permease protein
MKQKIGSNEARLQKWGYIFVLPFIVVFCAFNLYPTIYTMVLSFTDLQGLRSEFSFVGLANFNRLIHDQYFWGALKNTFIMWGMNFVPQLGIALLLSIWFCDVQLRLKLKGPVRAIIYLPNLLTAASVAMLFRSLFAYPIGPVNQFLQSLGIYNETMRDGELVKEAFNFFRNVPVTRGVVAFIQFWMWYGQTVILLMAGITAIPESLNEAAVIDGANSRQITWNVTLPLLRPILLYTLVTSMIGGMQMLEVPFLLTDMRGAPDYSIRTTSVYLYNQAFQGRNDYSYAAAISIGMFIVTMILAGIIFFTMQDRSDLKKKKGGAL